mmetsp:Transcript_20898/g.37241  ORF Transcript_20898/g.37241 Transcript_20898/m.37241 type:complete len:226 (-) Transcript_20898:323-1000(-)
MRQRKNSRQSSYGSISREDISLDEKKVDADSKVQKNKGNAKWDLNQRDSADTIRIVAILILWASFSVLIFVSQGDWFLDLVCSLLIIVSVSGLLGSFHGIQLGNILLFSFRTGLAVVALFSVMYLTLSTLEGSFEDDIASSRCGNATASWRQSNFCNDKMSESECEKTCKDTVSKDLRIELISCSVVVSASLLYAAYEVYKAEGTLYPSEVEKSQTTKQQSYTPI